MLQAPPVATQQVGVPNCIPQDPSQQSVFLEQLFPTPLVLQQMSTPRRAAQDPAQQSLFLEQL